MWGQRRPKISCGFAIEAMRQHSIPPQGIHIIQQAGSNSQPKLHSTHPLPLLLRLCAQQAVEQLDLWP